uniref:Uncharacterized protein n=1 Tax=Romanomermis culicivorax TaxID=13658 RepID=A0A915J664_ROMCU
MKTLVATLSHYTFTDDIISFFLFRRNGTGCNRRNVTERKGNFCPVRFGWRTFLCSYSKAILYCKHFEMIDVAVGVSAHAALLEIKRVIIKDTIL